VPLRLGGVAVTVTFDNVGGDPLAALEAQVGVARRRAAAAAHATCRFNGRVGTFHRVILQSKHQWMTASIVSVFNLNPPGSPCDQSDTPWE